MLSIKKNNCKKINKKLRVLLITLRSDYGGGPQHVDLLIENLSKEFDLYLGCPNDEPYFDKWKTIQRVKSIYKLPHRKFSFQKFFGLYKFVKNNQINLVHSHGKGAGIYSRLLKLIHPNLKVVHTLHGFHIQEYNWLRKTIYIFIEKFLSFLTDRFINVSYGEKNICLEFGIFKSEKSDVIYNGVRKIKRIEDAKEKTNLSGKFIVTTISRFDYQKNMYFAYEIAKRFKDDQTLLFLWLGDGNDKSRLEQNSKEEGVNIYFTGFTKDIPLYLSASDLYLSTSRWEGLPYALIEAQSLGIPIVATDVIGNNEVVEHGKNGYLFTNIDDACKYIRILIKNDTLYKNFSDQAVKNFSEKFYISIMVQKIEEIYRKVGVFFNDRS